MNEPLRLRHSAGPARALMRGAELAVPSAARRRALAFTAAAANVAVGGTALAAGGMSLVKSVVLCVSLGVVGGGLASLGVSSAIGSLEPAREAAPVRTAPSPRVAPTAAFVPAEEPAQVPSPVDVAPPPVPEVAPVRSAPLPTTSSAPAAARPPSLFDEQRVIESARAAIARGDASGGLRLLDDYSRSFPKGQFHPEALALRVEALSSQGDSKRAKALAEAFARKHPEHPLLPRVQASVGGL